MESEHNFGVQWITKEAISEVMQEIKQKDNADLILEQAPWK